MPHARLESLVAALGQESFRERLERAAQQARELAERLEKPSLEVTVCAAPLRFHAERWRGFWSAFVHLVRNAIDHGIEPPAERKRLGKKEQGHLRFCLSEQPGSITLELSDDGRGIDWQALSRRAMGAGLPGETRADLVEALFHEGVTTRDVASETSGRGAGLAALRDACRVLDGEIEVESTPRVGTVFRLRFPSAATRSIRPAAVTNSRWE
jgi:two-component system chemotaxis sensor kinase CheA